MTTTLHQGDLEKHRRVLELAKDGKPVGRVVVLCECPVCDTAITAPLKTVRQYKAGVMGGVTKLVGVGFCPSCGTNVELPATWEE